MIGLNRLHVCVHTSVVVVARNRINAYVVAPMDKSWKRGDDAYRKLQ